MQIVTSPDAPAAIGPYSQAIIMDGWVYTSGQIPLNAQGALVEGGITMIIIRFVSRVRPEMLWYTDSLATQPCAAEGK